MDPESKMKRRLARVVVFGRAMTCAYIDNHLGTVPGYGEDADETLALLKYLPNIKVLSIELTHEAVPSAVRRISCLCPLLQEVRTTNFCFEQVSYAAAFHNLREIEIRTDSILADTTGALRSLTRLEKITLIQYMFDEENAAGVISFPPPLPASPT